ncbi:MAG TPA: TonB-dependent receptor [Thermoanaerobaculia bacterium]|nr:TonB-dependent receptor [Thermoanaerobaculia bacterium]
MTHILFILVLAAAQPAIQQKIVVTASALPETVESTPAAVTVVTREEIDERAARDVADVLREVPGLILSRTGSQGRATSLFTRGSNSNHTLVLFNGIEITNPYFAGYDWGRFSTNAVQQVEVVRGPFSALYGSDAVAGVVNVLTTPRRSELRGDVAAGGEGLRNGSLTASYVRGASHFAASFESRADDGFAANDDFDQRSANIALRWKPADAFSLGLVARHTSYDLGVPFNLNAFATALVPSPNRRQEGTETQLAIPLEHAIGRFSYELTFAESRRDDDFIDPDDSFGLVSTSTESRTRRARLTTRTTTAFGTIVAGGEYERAEIDDVTNFGPNLEGNQRTEKSLFVEDRWTRETSAASRVELSAGFRYDDFDTFGAETSPRVAAAWITGSNKLRAAFGEAFRAPSLGELYFPFAGNTALEAETSRSWELGYDRVLGAGQFSATFFHSDYDNLIVFDNATFVFENIGAANARGVEVALQQTLASNLRGSLSYSYTDTEEEGADRPLARRPRHVASLFLGWRSGELDANVVVLYTGSRQDVLPVFPFTRAPNDATTTLDANVQYHLGRITPYVKVENLTNEAYEEVLGYPSPSRRAIVGVRFGM